MRKSHNTLALLIAAAVLVLAACSTDSASDNSAQKDEIAGSMTGGKADDGTDICETNGWYDDDECDTFCPKTDPDCAGDACRPICDAIGSRSEGWYDSCTHDLIGWARCDGCNAVCEAVGSRSEGWYDSCGVGMNGTGLIRFEQCREEEHHECPLTGVICTPDCPTNGTLNGAPCTRGFFNEETCVCEPFEQTCHPTCDAIGSRSEGWYDSCTHDLIGWAQCAGCQAECRNVGTRSEGWYDTCNVGMNGTGLIQWAACGFQGCPPTGILCTPECPESGTLNGAPCRKGNFNETTCVCEPVEAQECMPVCDAIGSRSEGWYDSCTHDLIGWAQCNGCEAECRNAGTRSEGWFDTCGQGMNGSGLITFAECAE